ncbi:hypothetical protein AB1Y20_009578 [Prymnesium parvum]|uniref:Uncharacterized protein n=1 Tax=Prymnesium parvum TaxID=97485 RepID=A0AB34K6X6_PRYPA
MRGGTPHAAAPSPAPSATELHELIVDYLSDLARSSPSNQPLEAATQLLREAFHLSSRPPPPPRRPSLWDLYAHAVRRLAPEAAAAPRPDATGDFDRFLLELHRRAASLLLPRRASPPATLPSPPLRSALSPRMSPPSPHRTHPPTQPRLFRRREAARREELAEWAARREELDARVDAEPHGEELAELLVLRATALLHLRDLSAAAQDAEAAALVSEVRRKWGGARACASARWHTRRLQQSTPPTQRTTSTPPAQLDNTRAVAFSRAGVAYEALGQFSQAISRGYQ